MRCFSLFFSFFKSFAASATLLNNRHSIPINSFVKFKQRVCVSFQLHRSHCLLKLFRCHSFVLSFHSLFKIHFTIWRRLHGGLLNKYIHRNNTHYTLFSLVFLYSSSFQFCYFLIPNYSIYSII